jgi:hypothetical protein
MPSTKQKLGSSKGPLALSTLVPIAIFAKLITGGFGQVQRHAFAGAKILIELEIDLRDEVVGIDFFCHGETRGGVCEIAGTLQLNTPEIQAARVTGPGKDGILILFAGHMKAIQYLLTPTARRIRVGWCDGAFNGSERLRFHPRPECLVFGDLILVRQRWQQRVTGQDF